VPFGWLEYPAPMGPTPRIPMMPRNVRRARARRDPPRGIEEGEEEERFEVGEARGDHEAADQRPHLRAERVPGIGSRDQRPCRVLRPWMAGLCGRHVVHGLAVRGTRGAAAYHDYGDWFGDPQRRRARAVERRARGGTFAIPTVTIPVTDPQLSPIVGVLGRSILNVSGNFSLGGKMGVQGTGVLCRFGTGGCSSALANIVVPFTTGGVNGVGLSGAPITAMGTFNVTVQGNPWTVGTVMIGGFRGGTAMGFVHGPRAVPRPRNRPRVCCSR
jgi:hypothetical protein